MPKLASPDIVIGLVKSEPSPVIRAFYDHHPLLITCDCGATAPLVRLSTATRCRFPIQEAGQLVRQADGNTRLEVCGEVHVNLTRGKLTFKLDALVVKNLESEILGGMPFLRTNKMCLDIPNSRILIDNGRHAIPSTPGEPIIKDRIISCLIRADKDVTLMPGEFVDFPCPETLNDEEISIEPHDSSLLSKWPVPQLTSVIDSRIRIPNYSDAPIVISKHQHVARARSVVIVNPISTIQNSVEARGAQASSKPKPQIGPFSTEVSIDPDNQLSISQRRQFAAANENYDQVFNPIIGKYNDASGRLRAVINVGKVEPPANKGRLPSYNRQTMDDMQIACDDLENLGVLAKPEEVGVVVENVSPSFLVDKPGGGKRFVTSFIGIAAYTKKPPSRVTSCQSVLRFLARWKFIIKTDMTKQFFQMLLQKRSMKYAGIITPYKGVRVYTRAAMGMPGSTEYLDELTFRVLGELIHQGNVSKIADDLYVGANDTDDLLDVWVKVLDKFRVNNLRLSASKTVICPKRCTILGWLWNSGTISPSPHKVNPLTTAEQPTTVKGLRSWLGAAKHLKACVPRYSSIFAPLESATASKQSRDQITWTEQLSLDFRQAQTALRDLKPVAIPKPDDKIAITTDGASHNNGVGAVMYIMRGDKKILGGYFSCKLNQNQQKWLPCEIEALAIAAAVNHWSTDIIESHHTTQIITDSMPCVQAYKKLIRGEFSLSMRLSTFLTTLSRFRVQLQHISGCNNQTADFLSRNPAVCNEEHCQVCSFNNLQQTATVQNISVSDILEGKSNMPFTNPAAWKQSQQDCGDLRRVYSHLHQGTRPTKKHSKVKDVKRYLQKVTIGRNGLLVVKRHMAFAPDRSATVIPRHLVHGLMTALHLKLNHPSKTQLVKLFERNFYALDGEEAASEITESCVHCSSLAKLPEERPQFTTSEPLTSPGIAFASDVMRRSKQKILVTRDCFSSFTTATFIQHENKDCFRSALIETTSDLRLGAGATIRVDGDSALQSLEKDNSLLRYGITLEIGRLKNVNKNPVAEKAIQELENELRKLHPDGAELSRKDLSSALHILNSRIRNRGLSAREILFQRDYVNGEQLKIDDFRLAESQTNLRKQNHEPSARSKVPRRNLQIADIYKPGDLIFMRNDGNKHLARQKYIVTTATDDSIFARKFAGDQYRGKIYELKPSEIFKLSNSASDPPTNNKREPFYESDDSDYLDYSPNKPVHVHDDVHYGVPLVPEIQGENPINVSPVQRQAEGRLPRYNMRKRVNDGQPLAPEIHGDNPIDNPPLRGQAEGRPFRHKTKTYWMRSGDYVFDW